MTPAQISCRLALAIGYLPEHVWYGKYYPNVFVTRHAVDGPYGRHFDYLDPAVIWPIAERFDCFPFRLSDGKWSAYASGGKLVVTATAAEAVALAVIGARP